MTETGETILIRRILEQAWDDVRFAPTPASQRWHDDAIRWFNSGADGPMSFHWICDTLNIDAGSARRAVLADVAVAPRTTVSGVGRRDSAHHGTVRNAHDAHDAHDVRNKRKGR
ncbi:hypothetical protein CMI37_00540 [Candidatus Pacearchaeota archaeon]|nr:hypothetical protein [Candidatus Pacearchaeota archaeon]|tara:strand:- start:210 stop:551 length:342 start_codon:yes stop_codon:yes gene_type:complete